MAHIFATKMKCQKMQKGSRNVKAEYIMDKTKLATITEEADLGIIIDEELNLYKHVLAVVIKGQPHITYCKKNLS